jgi:hypothetical protein
LQFWNPVIFFWGKDLKRKGHSLFNDFTDFQIEPPGLTVLLLWFAAFRRKCQRKYRIEIKQPLFHTLGKTNGKTNIDK